MRNNQLTAVLLGLFFLSTAANACLIYKYLAALQQAQQLQSGMVVVNVIQSLYNEAAEYSKTHPDMARVLQTPAATPTGVKPTVPAPARPPGK